MNFVLIGPTYPFRGGIAHYTTLLYQALAEQHEVTFISFKRQYPTFLFPGKTDRDNSQHPLTAPCQRLIDPLNPLSWWQTARFIRQYQPQAVIFQWWVPFWSPVFTTIARLVRNHLAGPIIFICHNVLPHDKLRPGERQLIKVALSHGDRFIVHSTQDCIDLESLLPHAEAAITNHPSYHFFSTTFTEHFPSSLLAVLPHNIPTLLFFGFVRPYKGLRVLLEAMPQILAQIKIHLLIVGEFWHDKADYIALIDYLELQPHLTIIDKYVPNEAVGQYFGAAEVVILPYLNATQSGVVQLAFGFGKPVITTAVGGLPEAVLDGQTGLIVPPDDSYALGEAVIHYFQAGLGDQFRVNIQQRQAEFSWQRMVKLLESLVQTS